MSMDRQKEALRILKEGTVIPATPLALNENRQFDEKQQRVLMRYYLDCGVGGIATAVHTTQFEIRKPQIGLFEPVLKVVSQEIDRYEKKTGKVIVKVAGVCGLKEQAVEEAQIAKGYGYDAVLVSPGGLGQLTEEELIERTQAIAEVLPVIGFYLQEAVGGRAFSYSYWQRICEIPNVVAIKCAPFHRYQTLDVVRAAACSSRSQEITLYTGNDDNIVMDLLMPYRFTMPDGSVVEKCFEGGLLGHWTVWTKKVVELFEQIKEAKNQTQIDRELLVLAGQVTDANSAFFDASHKFSGCIAGVHEVLRRQGLLKGIWCLNPEETLSEGQAEEIDRVSKAYPHLADDAFVKANLERWQKEEI